MRDFHRRARWNRHNDVEDPRSGRSLDLTSDTQRELLDLFTAVGPNWSPSSHAKFPGVFREQTLQFLLVNRRLRLQGSAYLPRDPLYLVIRNLAELSWVSEEDQVAEVRTLLRTTYESKTEEDLRKECTSQPNFAEWCEKTLNINVRKRSAVKQVNKTQLEDFLIDIELGLFGNQQEEEMRKERRRQRYHWWRGWRY